MANEHDSVAPLANAPSPALDFDRCRRRTGRIDKPMQHTTPRITRRRHLAQLSAGALGLALPGCASLVQRDTTPFRTAAPKSVAAVATVWSKWSHADVILSKILKGWEHDGGRARI